MSKILFVTHMMNSGGIARTISTLANFLSENNEVTILLTYSNDNKSFYSLSNRITIIPFLPLCKKKSFLRVRLLKKTLSLIKPDVVVSFHYNDSFFISLALKGNNTIKHIACERNDPFRTPVSRLKRFVRNKAFNMADACCFQTDAAKKYFRHLKKPCLVVSNPINLLNKSTQHNEELNKIIFTVGRLEKQKNHKILLEAFSKFHKSHEDYILKIYGVGSLRTYLIEYTKQLGISNFVLFPGESREWQFDDFDSSLFVLSSDYEGMPNALAEALALCIPCLATDATPGGVRELIVDGVNGMIANINDSNDLCKKMCFMIDNLELSKKMAMMNKNMSSIFSVKNYCEKWMTFIKELTDE